MNSIATRLDPLADVIGIGIGKAAHVLEAMLGSPVRLSVPAMRFVSPSDLAQTMASGEDSTLSAVEMYFAGEFSGCAELVFASSAAGRLVDCITADVPMPGEDLDSIRAGTLCEVGNIVINAVLGTIANFARAELTYTVPIYLHGLPEELLSDATFGAGVIILVTTRFEVESIKVDGDIIVFLSLSSFDSLEKAMESIKGGEADGRAVG